jgi:hypothetical protein
LLANGPKPTVANRPNAIALTVAGLGSSGAAEIAAVATEVISDRDGSVRANTATPGGAAD